MASSFMGLYVQRDALLISQKALDITGNNISNIHTSGYSRQRVDIVSIANSRNTLGYVNSIALAGRGSQAVGVAQVRDRVRDYTVRTYSGDLCNLGVKVGTMSNVETLFDSIEADANSDYLSAASLSSMLSQLKSALQSFSSDNADRSEIANIVMNAAKSLAQSVNNTNQKLDNIAEESITDTSATIDRINTILSEMGQLNKQIKDAYVSMGYITRTNNNYQVMKEYGPLELKDEMNSLLDELSQYGNVTYKEEEDGTFSIDFAGQRVVEGKKYAQMAMTEQNPRPTELSFVVTQVIRNGKGEIVGGLYDKDEWFDMHVRNNTGGDAQVLVRMSMKKGIGKYGEKVDTFNFTGKMANGAYYLSSGSLRGYLDVYNGRGIYADNPLSNVESPFSQDDVDELTQLLSKVNDFLTEIAGNPSSVTGSRLVDFTNLLKELGAEIEVFDDENNEFLVKLNGTTILDTTDGNSYAAALTPGGAAGDMALTISANGEVLKTLTNAHQNVQQQLDVANNALRALQDAAAAGRVLSTEELNELVEALRNSIGAEFRRDSITGEIAEPYIVEVNGVVIFDGTTAKALKLRNPDDPAQLGNVEVYAEDAGGGNEESIRTITTNSYNGVEYYRDMLNAFVRTITNEFNNVFKGVNVQSEAYTKASKDVEYTNSFLRELAAGNVTPGRLSTIQKYLEDAYGAGNVDIQVSTDADGNERYEVTIGGEPVLDADGVVTELRLVTSDTDPTKSVVRINDTVLNEPSEMDTYVVKNYEMFTFDINDFRRAAESFRVADDWLSDPMFIADPTKDNKYEELNNYYINKLLGLFSEDAAGALKYGDGYGHKEKGDFSLEKFIDHISGKLGDQVAGEAAIYTATDILLTGEETLRSETMDVSMNEEGISMMNYQKWYNAISRMISTMDEALDKLINQTGLVGLR